MGTCDPCPEEKNLSVETDTDMTEIMELTDKDFKIAI